MEGRIQSGDSNLQLNLLETVIKTYQNNGWKRKTNAIKREMEITDEDTTEINEFQNKHYIIGKQFFVLKTNTPTFLKTNTQGWRQQVKKQFLL